MGAQRAHNEVATGARFNEVGKRTVRRPLAQRRRSEYAREARGIPVEELPQGRSYHSGDLNLLVTWTPKPWIPLPLLGRRSNNNHNTFTWSGPSGVLGCTEQRPLGRLRGGACQVPIRCVGRHAVPLNLLNRVW
jgi:hypothetical protein